MAAIYHAPKQWCLRKEETAESLESWKRNLIQTLSSDPLLAPVFKDSTTWQKKTRSNHTRGLMDDPDDTPAEIRRTAVQKVFHLEYCLGQIANFAPVVSRNTIIRNSTSVTSVWHVLYQHYGFQEPRSNCLNPNGESLLSDEEPTDDDILLRQHIQLHGEDNIEEEECKVIENTTVKQLYGVCDKGTDCSFDRHLLPTIMDRCYPPCLETCQRHPSISSTDVHFPQAPIPVVAKESTESEEQTEDMTGNDNLPESEEQTEDMIGNDKLPESEEQTEDMTGNDKLPESEEQTEDMTGNDKLPESEEQAEDMTGNDKLPESEEQTEDMIGNDKLPESEEQAEDMTGNDKLPESEDYMRNNMGRQSEYEIMRINVQQQGENDTMTNAMLLQREDGIMRNHMRQQMKDGIMRDHMRPQREDEATDNSVLKQSEYNKMEDDNITQHEVSRPITSTGNDILARKDHRQQLRKHSEVSLMSHTGKFQELKCGHVDYTYAADFERMNLCESSWTESCLLLHPYQDPQELQCRDVEFRSLSTFSGLQIMDNDVLCRHVMSKISFQPTVGEHLTPAYSTMYLSNLYPVKSKLTLVPASVNLYQDNLDFWNDSADTLIINAIHATHESKEIHHHGCLSTTTCEESSLQVMFLKNSLHQPQCHSGLLLDDTLGSRWCGGEVLFLESILHGLPIIIALHRGFCLVVQCRLLFVECDLVQNTIQCCVTQDSAQGPVLMPGNRPAAVRGIPHGGLRVISLMWRMADCAVLMAANVDRGGLLESATTYCHGWKKVLPDASMAAFVVCVPPEDVPCAPPDVPPDIYATT